MTKLNDQIHSHMEQLDTDELLAIWAKNDRDQYAGYTFDIIRQILESRGEVLPVQSKLKEESEDDSRKGFSGFFSFEYMMSTSLIEIIYYLGLFLTSAIGIYYIFFLSQYKIGIFIVTLGNLAWRLICESIIVLFKIHDLLVSIDKGIKRSGNFNG